MNSDLIQPLPTATSYHNFSRIWDGNDGGKILYVFQGFADSRRNLSTAHCGLVNMEAVLHRMSPWGSLSAKLWITVWTK